MPNKTSSEAFFDAKYKRNPDPWNFAGDAYEQSRYAATLVSLNNRIFRRALEPGCSIGILTEQLAGFCGQVDAMDISATAVSLARNRCRYLGNVHVMHAALQDIPNRSYDLIVLSEIGYYFDISELAELGNKLVSQLEPDGLLLAVHWLGYSPDHRISGDQVHETVAAVPGLRRTMSERYPGFRLEQWIRS